MDEHTKPAEEPQQGAPPNERSIPENLAAEAPTPPATDSTTEEKPVQAKKKTAAKKTAAKKTAAKKTAAKKTARKPAPKVQNTILKLNQIRLSDQWNREELGDISGLVASLKEVGQLQAALVQPTEDPKIFELIDGRRRYAGLQQAGIPTILVTLKKVDKRTPAEFSALVANLNRKDNTPYELASGFDSLVKQHKMTHEQIALACDRTTGFISQHLAVLRAPKKLQTALRKGQIGVTVFRFIARLDPETDAKMLKKCVEWVLNGMSATQLDQKVASYLEKKSTKSGKKPPTKKGGAAHSRPKIEVRDYKNPELRRQVSMVNKTTALSHLETAADKLQRATTKDQQRYCQGFIDGMEMLTGLVVVDTDV